MKITRHLDRRPGVYAKLDLVPVDPAFPVHCPHVTIFRHFEIGDSLPAYWQLYTLLIPFLGPRRVGARFARHGCHNLQLHEDCELMGLLKHMQYIARACHLPDQGDPILFDDTPHIVWRWVLIDTYTDESHSMAVAAS